MIAIIDYGMGNLRSVQKGFERVGAAATVTRDAAVIAGAAGVVLPGVGAFGACMENLRTYELVDVVRRVVERGTPFLGICLGLQLLFEESEEFGPVRGLGIFPGRVVRFADRPDLKVPHMGWNRIRKHQDIPHLRGIDDGAFVYFVHSFYVAPADPSLTATSTDYGIEFTSAIFYAVEAIPNTGGMACKVTATAKSGKYSIVTEYVADPGRNTVLMRVTFAPKQVGYQLYVRFDPTVNGNGGGGAGNGGADSATVDRSTGHLVLAASDLNTATNAANRDYAQPVYAALDGAFIEATSGFAGTSSDGLVQLDATHVLTPTYDDALGGNVVQTARVAVAPDGKAVSPASIPPRPSHSTDRVGSDSQIR